MDLVTRQIPLFQKFNELMTTIVENWIMEYPLSLAYQVFKIENGTNLHAMRNKYSSPSVLSPTTSHANILKTFFR